MRSVLLAAALAVGALLAQHGAWPAAEAAAARATTAGAVPGPVVVIGTSGLRWDDVSDQTAALDALLSGSVGALVARSVQLTACPVDGWLAVSAGRRADDERAPSSASPQGCRPPAATPSGPEGAQGGSGGGGGGSGTVQRWQSYRARAAADGAGAVPGTLGDALAAGGRVVAAVGPGAAVALATSQGTVAHLWPGLPSTADGGIDPAASATDLATQFGAALATKPAVVVVDLGAVRDPPGGPQPGTPTRDDQVTALDDRLGLLLGALPTAATLVVASLADSGPSARLQLAAMAGPGANGGSYAAGLLRSGSTRQDGLVQATDLAPTVLHALALPLPARLDGAAIASTQAGPGGSVGGGAGAGADEAGRLQRLLDLDDAASTIDGLVTPFFVIALSTQFVLYLLLAWLSHRARAARQTRHRVLAVLRQLAIVGGCVPAATFLANLWPWWRADHPGVVLTIAVLTAALPLAAVALLGPWRRAPLGPAGVTGALTAIVLTADVATGSRLSLTTLMGGQPLIGGRYFGFSNPSFALFAVGALFAALALAQPLLDRGRRRDAVAVVALIGVAATLIDGLPGLGADFGGPPALVPAFSLLALRIAGTPLNWLRAIVIGAGTLAVLTAISITDWLRPADQRTHLGRFVQTVIDGGAGAVVQRKAEQNLAILTSTPLTLLIPVAAAVVVWALARPGRWHLTGLQAGYDRLSILRPWVAALGVLLAIGFALNDSGAAIPPVAMTLALPLLVAVGARCLVQFENDELDAAVGAARRPPGSPGSKLAGREVTGPKIARPGTRGDR